MLPEQLDLLIVSILTVGCCLMFGLGFIAGDAGSK